jgi:hypothetical protein
MLYAARAALSERDLYAKSHRGTSMPKVYEDVLLHAVIQNGEDGTPASPRAAGATSVSLARPDQMDS